MAAPMFGVGGKPIFGTGGKPLICDPEDECCDVTIANCAKLAGPTCTNEETPEQVLVVLPSVFHEDPSAFNHAGGSFVLDHYGSKAHGLFSYVPIGPAIDGEADPELQFGPSLGRDFGTCGYFGAIIGTHCDYDVRPFAAYQLDPAGTFYDNLRYIGYAYGADFSYPGPTDPTPTSHVWTPVNFITLLPLAWGFTDNTERNCATYTFTQGYAGASVSNSFNCADTGGATFDAALGACTLSLGPA